MREGELMFVCHFGKGYQLFYEKGAQIMQYVQTSQGNHIQPVTNILGLLVKSKKAAFLRILAFDEFTRSLRSNGPF